MSKADNLPNESEVLRYSSNIKDALVDYARDNCLFFIGGNFSKPTGVSNGIKNLFEAGVINREVVGEVVSAAITGFVDYSIRRGDTDSLGAIYTRGYLEYVIKNDFLEKEVIEKIPEKVIESVKAHSLSSNLIAESIDRVLVC